MATVIPLIPNDDATHKARQAAVAAAWKFAYSTLWYEQTFTAAPIKSAKEHLATYFSLHNDTGTALTVFCERVLLASLHLNGEPSRYVPLPSIWLNPSYPFGFAGTVPQHERFCERRNSIAGYGEGITVLALAYQQYDRKPERRTVTACRKKLLQLREYTLLQLFYNAIIYQQFIA